MTSSRVTFPFMEVDNEPDERVVCGAMKMKMMNVVSVSVTTLRMLKKASSLPSWL